MRLLVVVLFGLLLDELAVVVELSEEIARETVVGGGGGAAVYVEGDAELLEGLFDHLVVSVANVLRSDPFFLGADGDGHAVLIASANEDDLLALQTEVAHVDVGGHIDARQVPDMHTAVGIGQGRRDRGALEFLFHHV